jgi:PAS domain S-box-containing protein
VCASTAVALAILALAGWSLNSLQLARWSFGSIPMAPSTAVVVFLLGAGLLAHVGRPAQRTAGRAALAMALVGLAGAAVLLLQFVVDIELGIEPSLARTAEFGGFQPGRMSPITAAVAVVLASALLGLLMPPRRGTWPARLASAEAMAGTAVSSVMLLGYAYGTPLLYGSSLIPVALPTAAVLFCLGSGLVAAAGPGAWPMRALAGTSVGARLLRALLPTLLVLLVVEGWADTALWQRYEANPALAFALKALVSVAVFGGVVTLLTRRTSATIEQAQSALRVSERRYRAVTETASDAIVSADRRGNVVLWNRAAELMFGYTAEEALGRPLTVLMPDQFHAGHSAAIDRVLSSGVSRRTGLPIALTGRRKGGSEFPLELSLADSSADTDPPFTAILRDTTARRAAEAEREALIAELQRALSEVRTLTGIIPICAGCKKIRDDAGYWQAVELYVGEHTGADFSHSLCPDCMTRLYPELKEDPPDHR